MYKIPLLQRSILREMLLVFLLVLSLMVFLLILLQGKRMESFFVGLEITFIDILILLTLLMPYLLTFIFPITTMIAVFLVLFRMYADKEIVALRASGISILQLLPAVCVFALISSSISLWLFLYAVPQGTENFQLALSSLASQRANITIIPKIFYKKIPNTVLFAENVDADTNTMTDVFLEQKDSLGVTITVVAKTGSIIVYPENQYINLIFENGYLYRNEKNNFVSSSFVKYTVLLPISEFVGKLNFNSLDYDNMSLKDLTNEIEKKKLEEPTPVVQKALREMRIELQKRFVFPIACFVLALFTVPLATSSDASRNVVLLLLLLAFVVYYGFVLFVLSFAKSGMLPPIAIWIPNIVYLLFAIRGLYYASQEKGTLFILKFKEFVYTCIIFFQRKGSPK